MYLCNTSVLTPRGRGMCALVLTSWYRILHDVYIVLKSWHGAQGQGPVTDLLFCIGDKG